MRYVDVEKFNGVYGMKAKEVFTEVIRGKSLWEFVHPVIWDGKLEHSIDREYKISICTTCMNRANDIKTTYEKNIIDNVNYPNIEFILLNYNSRDDLDNYVFAKLGKYIDKEILNYYHTTEPRYYSMTHSRNVAFKVATGDIVLNVDADNFTNEGFAEYINILANQQPKRAIFAKGKRMMRGRLGFYRSEFIDLLGGYDEDLKGYGHDDHDIMYRAWGLGFKLMWFGSKYYGVVEGHKKHQGTDYQYNSWKYTERRNKFLSYYNLYVKKYKANEGHCWGEATLLKNFSEWVSV